MAQTGREETLLEGVARTRSTDGSVNGGLERVVRMAQSAALVHEAQSLAEIRPDLADEEQFVDPERRTRMLTAALIRPTGPRMRLSKIGVVVQRINLGLTPGRIEPS